MKKNAFDNRDPVIDMAERFYAAVHCRLTECGVEPKDALVACTYATHRLATSIEGNTIAGIEWMRDALDLIEREAMDKRSSV